MVAVNGDIDVILFQSADISFRRHSVACTKEAICSDIGTDDTGEYKGKTASQELLHDIFPVTVGGGAGTMEGFKNFMVGADGDDIHIFPDLLAFRRGAGLDGAVFPGDSSGEVLQKNIGQFCCQLVDRFPFRFQTKLNRGIFYFFFIDDFQI